MKIAIIGGGASGMAAAITAAESHKNTVDLYERQARVGRKLSATGNGRCNLTNLHAHLAHYHGNAPEFVLPSLNAMSAQRTMAWFEALGLYMTVEESGRVYPYSDQANSVVDVLRFALDKDNIRCILGSEVTGVSVNDHLFAVHTCEGSETYDRVVVACGGIAGSKLGGTLSGYSLLRSLGHNCTKLRPNLVQIQSSWKRCPSLKGIRANCGIRIFCDDVLFAQNQGEVQFTEIGISGPAVFEVSRDVCRDRGRWTCRLDFLPDLDEEQVYKMLRRKSAQQHDAQELFTGILHNRIGRTLCACCGIGAGLIGAEIPEYLLREAAFIAKNLEIPLSQPLGMENAQVTAGGILTDEFDPNTLESKLIPGLYACGEVLDIDGDCGGYNLQWAWSSGIAAGLAAGKDRT